MKRLLAILAVPTLAHAATLQAGAGQTYATPCAAIAAAQAGDEIDVAPGTYTDSCEVNPDGLVIKGVGGRPVLDLSGTDHPADYKGIFVVNGANVRIENLELTGANIPVDAMYGGNGAGIRAVGNGLVVHGCYIHDNQDGILGTANDATGTITIEETELARNGRGNACVVTSCTHNVYITGYGHLVFQSNWTHDIANDTPMKGHLLKSRALVNDVLYNRITGEGGLDSYEVDLPNGGLSTVIGNLIEKGPNAGNEYLLQYGEEGLSNPDMRLFVAYNTFVNDLGKGTYIQVASGGTLTAHDNLFAGAGTVSSTGALSADNLATMSPGFTNAAGYDYTLTDGSPAIGVAVDPGSADSTSLVPTLEYLQPTSTSARATHLDVGAYEHGAQGGAADAGCPLCGGDTDAGGVATQPPAKAHGCDYSGAGALSPIVVLLFALLVLRRLT